MTAFHAIGKWLDKLYGTVGVGLLAAIVAASSVQVFSRYVMHSAVTGTEEFSRYCFIWMSMLGASIAVGQLLHPSVTIVTDRLHGGARKVSMAFIYLIIIGSALLLTVYGIKMVSTTTRQLSSILRLPMCYIYLSLPVGGIGMIVHALINMADELIGKKEESV